MIFLGWTSRLPTQLCFVFPISVLRLLWIEETRTFRSTQELSQRRRRALITDVNLGCFPFLTRPFREQNQYFLFHMIEPIV